MPKKISNPVLVVEHQGRFAGWIGGVGGCRLYGDPEWVASALGASDAKLEFDLHEGRIPLRANIDDPLNPAGAFAAFAWLAKERIRVKQSPSGLMESLGMFDEPEAFTLYDEEADSRLTDEERAYYETHYLIETERGENRWIPLTNANKVHWAELVEEIIKDGSPADTAHR